MLLATILLRQMWVLKFLFKYLQDIAKYKLGNPKSFHYLNQSNCYELDGVNDAHEYLATRRAMDIVGISDQEQVYLSSVSKLYILVQFNSDLIQFSAGGNFQGCCCNSSSW